MPFLAPPPSCKVYTPDELAAAMVEAVGDQPRARWLEPSHGRGAFLRALQMIGVGKERIVAIDLDRRPADSDMLARTRRGVDFLTWSSTTRMRFDRIVGNPPYVAIRRLPPKLRNTAASVLGRNGEPVGIRGNLWQTFVLASLRVLAPGGAFAFVLPSAAEYANYSAEARVAVKDKFDVLEVYRCHRPLFDDVQEGTIVVIARGYGGGPCRYRREEVASRSELIHALRLKRPVRRSRCRTRSRSRARTGVTFGELATVRVGGVTGDADYFLLSESQRRSAGLPIAACSPVVTRCRHVKRATIDVAAWQYLRDEDERVWLFNPPDELLDHDSVKHKLALDMSAAGCNRRAFKIAARDPWYRTPMPHAPHAFMSGMHSIGPLLTLNEMPGLNATNTLYVIQFANSLSRDDYFSVALALLTSSVRKQLARVARRYADGLCKYEPGSLRELIIPEIASCRDSGENYAVAVAAFLSGDNATARRLADRSFGQCGVASICRHAPA